MSDKQYSDNQISAILARYKSNELPAVKQAMLDMQAEIERNKLRKKPESIEPLPMIKEQSLIKNTVKPKEITQAEIDAKIGPNSTFVIEYATDDLGYSTMKLYKRRNIY